MTVATKLKLVVVPHTHWDREWYLPFEQFRLRLVRLIDRLIALFETDPAYTHFMLDGQTIVLEDYLEIRPDREAALRALVESGRMAVGPWYVLPDEFLVSGESIVRNLQIGMATARRFGKSMELGYLPDSFGHLAQMPQVFAGFGFDAGCLWRGVGDDNPGAEWRWAALDGTSLYIQWLAGGYGNFANLPADPEAAYERLQEVVESIGKVAKASTYLLMNGSDHLMPQPFLPSHLAAFNARNPAWELVQASLPEAIARARAEARDLATVTGELRQAADTSLLPGVLSARTYLKIANAHAQNLLERWVEPFSALAALSGRAYPADMLRYAWRLLLQNHPHDSICGCSVDPVHRQMMTRFEQLDELATVLRHEAFAVLRGEDPEADLSRQAGLQLFNPHPWAFRGPVEAELTLDCAPDEEPALSLVDEAGRKVPFELLSEERGVRVVNRSPEYPYNVAVTRTRLRLVADLPAFGYRTLRIERAKAQVALHPTLSAGEAFIANAHFRVAAVPGGVAIRDLALGETVIHRFEDVGDRGDEYNFCPVEGEAAFDSRAWSWRSVDVRSAGETLVLTLEADWVLPAGLSADRTSREGEAPCGLRLEVSLHAGVRRVEFAARLRNRSRDHRLRAGFQLPAAIPVTHADTAFGWVSRSSEVPDKPWAEKPMGTYPMQSMVLCDRPAGLAGLASVGLHEYEAVGDTVFLTLLRSVGWLSREDLSTRKGDAGPMLASPEAQCLGEHAFRYAWVSQGRTEAEGLVFRRGQEFVVPPVASAMAEWTGHAERSFLEVDQPAWHFSALKQAESGDRLVLRVFNGSPSPREGRVRFGFPVRGAWQARLDETPGARVEVADGGLTATLRPFEIATFLLEV